MSYIPNHCVFIPSEYDNWSGIITWITNTLVWFNNWLWPLGEFMCTLVFYLIIISIIITILFFLKWYWIYKLSKRNWLKNAYFSWIPFLQTYQFIKLSWRNTNLIYPLMFWYIAFIIWWFLINIYITYSFSKKFHKWFWSFLLLLILPSIFLNTLKFENIKIKEKSIEL